MHAACGLIRFCLQDGDEKEEDAARKLLEACHELGIGVQIALAKPSDVDWFYAYRQYGVIPESCKSLLLILGEDGDVPSSNPHALRPYLANLEKQNLLNKVVWSVSAFGLQETESLTAAIALGGHVAPGFAFNIHTVEGEAFGSPSDPILVLRDIAQKLGRSTASAFEARMIHFGVG